MPKELRTILFFGALLLEENNFTGTIPPSFGNASSLKWFVLAHNNIHGRIPTEVGQLPNLQEFYLSFNRLTGSIISCNF
ncbi:hypothetical protein ACSBR2_025246 [Camellia fascicularis]